jgi:hypothetical protein
MITVLAVISTLAKIAFFAGVALFIVAFYQQTMLVREWYEDHAPPGGWLIRGLLSTQVIFYPSLSARCRRRRRRLVAAGVAGFALVIIAVFAARFVEGLA